MSLKIDPEFQSLIPPLTSDEYKQLEENVVREGIRDPLVVWEVPNGDQILIDGHNRWKIAAEHGGIPFEVRKMTFNLRDDVKAWIIRNQFGRRNLSAYDRSVLALKLKPLIAEKAKKKQAEYHGNQYDGLLQKSAEVQKPINTREELAKAAGVSHDTIHKVEVIEKDGSEELKQQIRSGKISINQAHNQVVVAKAEAEGRIPPTRSQKKAKEYTDAVERHETFEKSKDEGVVSFSDVKQDQSDRKTIARKLYTDMASALTKLYWSGALNKREVFGEMRAELEEKELKNFIEQLQSARTLIGVALMELGV